MLRILYFSLCLYFFAGRVHSAVVSGINADTRSVTVEWFEKGETKGKEVSINSLLTDISTVGKVTLF